MEVQVHAAARHFDETESTLLVEGLHLRFWEGCTVAHARGDCEKQKEKKATPAGE